MIEANGSRNRIPHKVFRDVDECSVELNNLPHSNLCVVNNIKELNDKLRQLGVLLITPDNVDELTYEAVMIIKVSNPEDLRKLLHTFAERFTIWATYTGIGADYHETLSVLEDYNW